jgi:archaellum biogenesis ATPase FlaH
MDHDAIYAALSKTNEIRCKPPLDDAAIRRIAQSASQYKPEQTEREPQLIHLTDIEPKQVDWLWHNRFPMGKLSLLVGDPGVGKSYLTLFIAAVVSNGEFWPDLPDDYHRAQKGSVLLISSEDDIADTIRPRLDALGADVTKIIAMEGIAITNTKGENWTEAFCLERDLQMLEKALHAIDDTQLIILDPITAYFSRKTDSHKNAEVRGALTPLMVLAAKYKVAIIGISHLTKNTDASAVYRVLGSMGFVGAARAVWVASYDKNDESKNRRFLSPCKTTLSVSPTSLMWTIEDGKVNFLGDPVHASADDALRSSEEETKKNATTEAKNFLVSILANGPQLASCVFREAKELQIGMSTLKKAKGLLKIESKRENWGPGGQWYWQFGQDGDDDVPI